MSQGGQLDGPDPGTEVKPQKDTAEEKNQPAAL